MFSYHVTDLILLISHLQLVCSDVVSTTPWSRGHLEHTQNRQINLHVKCFQLCAILQQKKKRCIDKIDNRVLTHQRERDKKYLIKDKLYLISIN